MKKLLLLSFCLFFAAAGFSQTTAKDSTAPKKELSKEEKAALKAKQDADLMEAYKAAELTDEQIATVKSAIDQANKQYNEIKNNPALSDEDKASAKKLISDQKNAKLKEIMGAENYSKYNAVRKKQKAASPGQ